jgi:NAD(P)H-dependent flavin oxidoreductase YrpB (nitropropane dioxygenase family)
MGHPVILQGGMGAGVSGWRLARAVAAAGQLGTVSGTGLDVQLARRLQRGDLDGHLRRSMARFPNQDLVRRVLERYFVPDGLPLGRPFAVLPRHSLASRPDLAELAVLGAFVEVDLARDGARDGHSGLIGINCLQKIVLPTLPTLYGALLAGVDYVMVGAGIPLEIPAALAALVAHRPASLSVEVAGDENGAVQTVFDPAQIGVASSAGALSLPYFFPIISAVSLAQILLKRAKGPVDGFIVEGPMAGGHNAPPRGAPQFDDRGQPVYGVRDEVDLTKLGALGKPFWLAGRRGRPGELAAALRLGAAGIQVGTAFAFCRESGLDPALRDAVLAHVANGGVAVRTDPRASPTGFPFKVVELPGTLADESVYAQRDRVCNLGFLRAAYRRPNGQVGFRCPAEPVTAYVAKGGSEEDTAGRKCLCNALLANVSLGDTNSAGQSELPILTAGDDLECLRLWIRPGRTEYSAQDVLRSLGATP